MTIKWNLGQNVFLTTCEDAGTEDQSTSFLSNAAGGDARKLVYGRPVLKRFLYQHQVGPVPDKFAPRPYCTLPSLPQVANSTFVLLDKLPTDTEDGYCFEPTYVHYDKGQVTIDTGKARIDASNKDYYGTLPTAQQQSNLAALIHQYGTMPHQRNHTQPGGPSQSGVRQVMANRAYLYEKPENHARKTGYLIRGDTVVVLQEVGAWVRIRYRQANGNGIVRWVRSVDLVDGL